jgi:gamma-glutamyl:cysteine ligase YbdK (ATP-grasp superfamily)
MGTMSDTRSICPYAPFSVTGIELEYAVVDDALTPRLLVEPAFRAINGRPTSSVEHGSAAYSNELAAHVFEIKTPDPMDRLVEIEADLHAGVRFFSQVLRDDFGGRLMPTGMHPTMLPGQTDRWRRANAAIYEAYDKLFGIGTHGWLNVQSCHVNLPFGSEADAMAQHNALALLMPYLPALAASSPIFEGRVGPDQDNRLAFYRDNQLRFPQITAGVIPERIDSFRDYRRRVLTPIRDALRTSREGRILAPEWVNSRGAILRFERQAIELRILDTQECVMMDIAIACYLRGALRWATDLWRDEAIPFPDHAILIADFNSVVRGGRQAEVQAPHLRELLGLKGRTVVAQGILEALLEHASALTPGEEQPYLDLVERRLARGNLSERILERLGNPRPGDRVDPAATGELYDELCERLERNAPWTE